MVNKKVNDWDRNEVTGNSESSTDLHDQLSLEADNLVSEIHKTVAEVLTDDNPSDNLELLDKAISDFKEKLNDYIYKKEDEYDEKEDDKSNDEDYDSDDDFSLEE